MQVDLRSVAENRIAFGFISTASVAAIKAETKGWQFTWEAMTIAENSTLYKLTVAEPSHEIQGLLMLSIIDKEMVYMNNVEVAPHNFGINRKFVNVAGVLVAFACLQSFEMGQGNYAGYLSFDSKSELIELYKARYGATHIIGSKMFFDPAAGSHLINKYLK